MVVTSADDPFVVVGATLTDGEKVIGVGDVVRNLLRGSEVRDAIREVLAEGNKADALALVTRNSLYGTREVNTLRGVESLNAARDTIEQYLSSLGPFWVGGPKETSA